MFAAFWLLLAVLVRTLSGARRAAAPFVLAGCAALAVGTLQGPIQAVPAVNELLDRGGEAGDVIVNLHAQLNMLGGLMVLLVGAGARAAAARAALRPRARARRRSAWRVYYAAGVAFSARQARVARRRRVRRGGAARSSRGRRSCSCPRRSSCSPASRRTRARSGRRPHVSARGPRGARGGCRTRYAGRIPARVRRLQPRRSSPPTSCRWACSDSPGVGWLFAGFPLQASVLLCGGPRSRGPCCRSRSRRTATARSAAIGWKIELVYLPVSALLSGGAALPGAPAPAAPRARPDAAAPRSAARELPDARRRSRPATLLLLLVSLPFVPAVAGIGDARRPLHAAAEAHAGGDGPVPRHAARAGEALRLAGPAGDVSDRRAPRSTRATSRSLVVRAAALDATSAYRAVRRRREPAVPLAVRARGARSLSLAPVRPLAPGRYVFTATHEGMFGGRDYAYVTIVRPGAAVSPLAPARRTPPGRAGAPADRGGARRGALRAAARCARTGGGPPRRRLLWAGGFLLFAVAAACEAARSVTAGRPLLFRTYYLCGGVLTVAAPRRGLGAAAAASPAAATPCSAGSPSRRVAAAVDGRARARRRGRARSRRRGGRPPANGALGGPRVPVGDRAELARHVAARRRLAALDRPPAATSAQTSGSAAARSSSHSPRPLARRRLLLRVRRRSSSGSR